jgi:hypothetical protein
MRTREAELIGVILVACASWHALDGQSGWWGFALSLLSLAIVWTVSILLHEFGHALAAWSVNLEPIVIVVGGGPSLLRREIAGVALDLGWLPGGGRTMIVSREGQQVLKWRLLACYAGGPVVSIGLLLGGMVLFPLHWDAFRTGSDAWIMPGAAVVLANGLIVFTSIVPLPRASDVSSVSNDLVQMLSLPWLKTTSMEAFARAAAGARFARLCLLGKYQAAFEEAHQRLAADPGNWTVRIQLADMLIFAGRYAEAEVQYGALLEEPALSREGIPPLAAALVANNYAWAIFMLNDPMRLKAADRASAKALAAAPDHPNVLGTRGAILVELGEVVAGQRLLTRSLRLHRERFSRASALACLAFASARQGDQEESLRLLAHARRLDRDCDVLIRVEGAASLV